MLHEDTTQSAVRCPRCGYDQRGEIGRWTTTCPLNGVCAECGLDVSWPEIVNPERFLPLWSVEYGTGLIGVVRGATRSAWRSLRPRRFWTSMKMSHPVRGRRLAAYLLFLLLLPLFTAWIQQGVAAVGLRNRVARNPSITAVAYTYPEAVFDAMFRPLARKTSGVVFVAGGGSVPYPPPRALHSSLWTMRAIVWVPNFVEEVIAGGAVWGLSLFVLLVFPVSFALLPVSRRRAKVRWAHVWRVAIYSLLIPSLAASSFFCALMAAAVFPARMDQILIFERCGLIALPIPALIIWWAIAIKRYLRMPHGAAIAVLLGVIAVLLAPALVITVSQLGMSW